MVASPNTRLASDSPPAMHPAAVEPGRIEIAWLDA